MPAFAQIALRSLPPRQVPDSVHDGDSHADGAGSRSARHGNSCPVCNGGMTGVPVSAFPGPDLLRRRDRVRATSRAETVGRRAATPPFQRLSRLVPQTRSPLEREYQDPFGAAYSVLSSVNPYSCARFTATTPAATMWLFGIVFATSSL